MANQRGRKKSIAADTKSQIRFEKRWMNCAGFTWSFMENSMFAELCDQMKSFYQQREDALKALDEKREADPEWYKKNDMLGMMFYIDNFAGNMKGVEGKLDYLEKNNKRTIFTLGKSGTISGDTERTIRWRLCSS